MALYTSNGQILGYNGIWNCETCPCGGVPCTCPCTTWLPESWPCGGLNETYVLDNGMTSVFDGTPIYDAVKFLVPMGPLGTREARLTSPTILTAGVVENWGDSCLWVSPIITVQSRRFDLDGNPIEGWTDYTLLSPYYVKLFVGGDPCFWEVVGASNPPRKDIGGTPVGTYFNSWYPGYAEYKSGFIIS